jgi:hypothetical protein
MKTEKRQGPNENQSVVEWFNNELTIWRAKWDLPDKHVYIEESSNEFYELMEQAKEYEDIKTIKSFNAGFHCCFEVNKNKISFYENYDDNLRKTSY